MHFARVLPWALLLVLFAVEITAMGRKRAESQRRDAGSFVVVNVCFALAFTAAFWMARGPGEMSPEVAGVARVAAVVVAISGAAIRIWAIATLGRYFTRTVQVSSDQPVVQRGPYRFVRHPSYTGLGLLALAIALALSNWFGLALVAVASTVAAVVRIRIEEAALLAAIGEPYAAYMGRTKRLIPFVF